MTIKDFNQERVLTGCIKNDRRMQELLYRHFAGKMYAVCLSYTGDRPVAQDILQESFVKVFRNIKKYNNDGSLEGWIRKIVTNTAIDHLRKKKVTREYIDNEPSDPEFQTYNTAIRIMGFNELMEQIKRLPEGARLVFNLHAVDGYSHKEIASQLNITEGTSKSQFNRARKLLMSFIGNMNL
jgi:RNA polymerase sigma factor (sigma-70 family)